MSQTCVSGIWNGSKQTNRIPPKKRKDFGFNPENTVKHQAGGVNSFEDEGGDDRKTSRRQESRESSLGDATRNRS